MPVRSNLRVAAGLLLAALAPAMHAAPNLAKYPLRINILSSNTGAYWVTPSLGGPALDVGSMAAAEGDAGAPGAPMGGGLTLNYDPVQMFYGNGKADLVSPTAPTLQGVTFIYTNCMGRLAMTLPDKPFNARWKKKNTVLELLVPLENTKPIKPGAKPPATKYDKCDVQVTLQRFVYLLMQNGQVVAVTQDDFAKKPSLKQFTVGLDPRLRPRTPAPAANPARRQLRPTTPGAPGASGAPTRPANNPGSAASDSSPSAPR